MSSRDLWCGMGAETYGPGADQPISIVPSGVGVFYSQ